jgi:hypothetical protein
VPTVTALRYVQPLREGGSLPAVVETDEGLYVTKFRGAGQGAKALVAELVFGSIAAHVDLPVPDVALVDVDPAFGATEPDPEIQDILRGSRGLNVGLRYLDGAFNFDAGAAGELVGPELAAEVVWMDAFLTNPDRTARNPNLLIWRRSAWLIDHGAALYAHHDWSRVDEARTRTPFERIRDHVLLERAGDVRAADDRLAHRLDEDVLAGVLDGVPDTLLADRPGIEPADPAATRARYVAYLLERLAPPRPFVAEAERARALSGQAPPHRLSARR